MAVKPETTFTNAVHAHLPPGRKAPYWMKNHNEYTSGVFDCWYSGVEGDLWVEYKFIKLPARPSTLIVPSLSDLQLEWGKDRYEEGRNVVVIVGCKEGGVVFANRGWEGGILQSDFKKLLRTRKQLAEWIIGQTEKGG